VLVGFILLEKLFPSVTAARYNIILEANSAIRASACGGNEAQIATHDIFKFILLGKLFPCALDLCGSQVAISSSIQNYGAG